MILTDRFIISAANSTKTLRKQKQYYIEDLSEKTYILSYKDCYVCMLTKNQNDELERIQPMYT